MSKLSIIRAGVAAAALAMSPAAFAQENAAVNAADPAMNTTADPLANDIVSVNVADPLANDPLAAPPATDPLAADPMLNAADEDDDDDGRFPWGLLGLLGLAGLLGTKRRDDDVRVDRTRDTR